MPSLELNFLGGYSILVDGQSVTGFESDKVRLLLAYLVIESGRPQRRDILSGLFWPESSEKRARQSLSQALYNLRQLLGKEFEDQCLDINSQDILFHPCQGVEVDASQFIELVNVVTHHPHSVDWACRGCQTRLEAAGRLFSGELLAGLSLGDSPEFEGWLLEQRTFFSQKALIVFESLAHSQSRRGERLQALENTERLVMLEPLNEAYQRLAMELLAATGQRAKALSRYNILERQLADELEIEPEAETRALAEKIRKQEATQAFGRLPPHNLPAAATPMVGRQVELDELYWNLLDPNDRLITLFGPGGCGKTRLALESGRKTLPAFRDGVYLVELGVLASPFDLIPALARTLIPWVKPKQFPVKPEQQMQDLVDHIQKKDILLILDGAEMVLEGVAVLSELLQKAPGLHMLVTTRARLNLVEERVIQLSGLPFPVDASSGWMEFPAVELFMMAARRSNPDFKLSDHEAGAVVEICRILHGMPLAILLAAAWESALSPERILNEILASLEFLAGGWQDLPERQRSLRATFEYSWGLLWEEERSLLRKLAIFRQPFGDDQARKIAQASANSLRALLDFSLVQRVGRDRLALHDLVRQFAQEKLIEAPQASQEVHVHFANHYLERLAEWDAGIKSERLLETSQAMDHEIENARLAWDWMTGQMSNETVEPRLPTALEGLCYYYERRGQYARGESACRLALSRIETAGLSEHNLRLWARAATWQGRFWIGQGRAAEGLAQIDQALKILDEEAWQKLDTRWERAQAGCFILLAKVRSENELALECARRSADLFLQCADRWYAARSLVFGAAALESLGRFDEQIQMAGKALSLQTPGGDPELVHYIRYVLGCGYFYHGDMDKGVRLIAESADASSGQDEKWEFAQKLIHQSVSHIFGGNYPEALKYLEHAQAIYQELGKIFDDTNLIRLIGALWGSGRYERVEETANKISDRYAQSLIFFQGYTYLLLRKYALAKETLDISYQAALETSNLRVIGTVKAFSSVANYCLDIFESARLDLIEALGRYQSGNPLDASAALLALAFYLVEEGSFEQGLEVFTTACKVPFYGKSAWTWDFLGNRLEALAQDLPGEAAALARQRGLANDPKDLACEWAGKVESLIVLQK